MIRAAFFWAVAVVLGLIFLELFLFKIASGNWFNYVLMFATAGGSWAAIQAARSSRAWVRL